MNQTDIKYLKYQKVKRKRCVEQMKCKHCGETKNLHFNYAYDLPNIPIESILCNECGEITENTTKEVTNESNTERQAET
jgi:Zn ribbon nucleic-acid-binding protein